MSSNCHKSTPRNRGVDKRSISKVQRGVSILHRGSPEQRKLILSNKRKYFIILCKEKIPKSTSTTTEQNKWNCTSPQGPSLLLIPGPIATCRSPCQRKSGHIKMSAHRGKTMWGHREKTIISKGRREASEENNPADTLTSDFWPPGLRDSKWLLSESHCHHHPTPSVPVWHFVAAALSH